MNKKDNPHKDVGEFEKKYPSVAQVITNMGRTIDDIGNAVNEMTKRLNSLEDRVKKLENARVEITLSNNN